MTTCSKHILELSLQDLNFFEYSDITIKITAIPGKAEYPHTWKRRTSNNRTGVRFLSEKPKKRACLGI